MGAAQVARADRDDASALQLMQGFEGLSKFFLRCRHGRLFHRVWCCPVYRFPCRALSRLLSCIMYRVSCLATHRFLCVCPDFRAFGQ